MRKLLFVVVALLWVGCACEQMGSCDSDESRESSERDDSTYAGGCGGPFDEPPGRDLSVPRDLSRPALDLAPPDDGGADDGGATD